MRKVALFVCVALLAVAGANAELMYGIQNQDPTSCGSNSLITFDSANPAGWTAVGPFNVPGAGFAGLDFAGVGGGLYGYVAFGTGITPGLYSVNPATGAATVQGTLSGVGLQDLAWRETDPATGLPDQTMYGIDHTTLYTVDLTTGAVAVHGNITGYTGGLEVGLAADSAGDFYAHDLASDIIYKVDGTTLAATVLHNTTLDCNYSQGLFVDWSRNDDGYHGALSAVGSYYDQLYGFDTAGTTYSLIGNFTPIGTFPTVECGDLTMVPVPEPASVLLLGIGGLALLRRR